MNSVLTVTRDDVKRLAVYKQGLHLRPESNSKEDLKQIIERIGLLQLDSISVVERSHYLVMLARAGLYNRQDLDELLTEGFLFEQWSHVACQIPMKDYPYYYPNLLNKRKNEHYPVLRERIGENPEELMAQVIGAIRENGPMASKDFDSPRLNEGGWWNWKPAKNALEYLFMRGELMVKTRKNFHRYYDLPERVLEGQDFVLNKSLDDYYVWTVESGLRHVGIGTVDHIADYYRQGKRGTLEILQNMIEGGDVLPVTVDGWKDTAFIHKDNLPLLEQVQAGQHAPQLTAFLSPFDSLVWHRDRNEHIWDFYYRIEVYTPKPKRIYGYYVMPILHNGEVIGRMDPKVERKGKHFIMNALHFEDGLTITDELKDGLVSAICEFMAFHNCQTFELGNCADTKLKKALLQEVKARH